VVGVLNQWGQIDGARPDDQQQGTDQDFRAIHVRLDQRGSSRARPRTDRHGKRRSTILTFVPGIRGLSPIALRNGVVRHPREWPHGGYSEIQSPPERYRLINRQKLVDCCGFASDAQLRSTHRALVEAAIGKGDRSRRTEWTESVAMGSDTFVGGVLLEKLKLQAGGRRVKDAGDHYELREPEAAYNANSDGEMGNLRANNKYFWDEFD